MIYINSALVVLSVLGLRFKVNVSGIVQGVGFRPFVYRLAVAKGLKGYVRNLGDAGVEILLEGPEGAVAGFLSDLQTQKPPQANIYTITQTHLSGPNQYTTFAIQQSSNTAQNTGSVIPPDISICNDCLRELRSPSDPRFDYFFITCTNCGPRFTIIKRLPYDRENTTMKEFPLCGFCAKEYRDPANRRFHAQTVACPVCGPKAYLTTNKGEAVSIADPVREAGRLISEGQIVALKGYGGFHLATSAVLDAPLQRLRTVKHRTAKPFALMVKSLDAARSFANINEKEAASLTSSARPIVLLDKNSGFDLSELVAPKLHNIGVMLPCSAMHYMLFDQISDKAVVATSANPANQPIIADNQEAQNVLGGTVAYFLFHNRQIAQRCDDSVTRVHGDRNVFVRRSRGYAPAPIKLKLETKRNVVALGGELNVASCVLNGDKAFLSQHIGDAENLETKRFLQDATAHLMHLTNCKVEAVACDLHPKFTTTHLAQELAERNGWALVQVQHHFAHGAALMAEYGVDNLVAVACDGYGYGLDGSAWGGEILHCTAGKTGFERLGHLESQLLIGGDTATRYPLRIAAAILNKNRDITKWLTENSKHLPHGETEAKLILSQLRKPESHPQTTSLGRVLDAAAAIIGICYERTYEGEAAMKLESAATTGKDALQLPIIICQDTLNTSQMLADIFDNRQKVSQADLAYSVHPYLAQGLAELAIEKAKDMGVETVGFTGGAAVNSLLAKMLREAVEAAGLQFLEHEAVPCGDGGLALGQAFVAAN
jgi:hydrogenase maturation protein HypF